VPDGIAIGVDAGASKTTGVLVSADRKVLKRETAGGANIRVNDPLAVAANLRRVIESLAQGVALRAGCVAAAGTGRPADAAALEQIVRVLLAPGVQVTICHDAQAWLRAGTKARPAMVVAAGTGSIAYGERADGSSIRAGGYGAALGDAGSGYAIGLGALRSAAHALDGLEPRGALVESVLAALGATSVAEVMEFANRDAGEIAALAPLVALASEKDDEVARQILEQQAGSLGAVACRVANAVRDGTPLPVVLAGGAFDAVPALTEAVKRAVGSTGPCEIVRPTIDAAVGAALIALDKLKE
jgi:N-acetylglucosamine kinase-like BadF-type ATPase